MKKTFALLFPLSLCFIVFINSTAQQPSSLLKLKLKKLNFLGSVLYVAAHPDDENTRIITYLANGKLAETAYLSLTRGDGGQNLIGQETGELLGLIRTQELLTARKIDGGNQFFSHANDFGFSKSASESLQFWGKEQLLSDVVKIYRQFRPDVIITRFPADERAGHGHHIASAMLAQEAFDVSANEALFPTQVSEFGVWQPKTIYTNTGRFWNTTINENTPGILTMDVGGFEPFLGKSYTEIAALSRSQHKSQGFGSKGTRGYQPEFLEFVKGERATKDIFENINTSWLRVKGGDKIQPLVTRAINEFDDAHPAKSISTLLEIRKAIQGLDKSVWKDRKLQETEDLIVECAGLYLSVSADRFWVNPAGNVQLTFDVVNRSEANVTLDRINADGLSMDSTLSLALVNNKAVTFKSHQQLVKEIDYSSPYWLKEKHPIGNYVIKQEAFVGKPENEAAIKVEFALTIQGEQLLVVRPVLYRETDAVKGELTRSVEVVPPAFVNPAVPVVIFHDEKAKSVTVKVISASENKLTGAVSLRLPEGWKCQPVAKPIELTRRGEELSVEFFVSPPKTESQATIKAQLVTDQNKYDQAVKVIEYDHIPTQTLLSAAEIKVVRLDIIKKGAEIGYIKGSGDDVPAGLRNLGYEVIEFKDEEVTAARLATLDAIVIGIRAFNTNDRLLNQMPSILEYVKKGGTAIAQYNNPEADASKFAPYPLTISRDRVTEEDADVTFINPLHRVLNYPNKITAKDFNGWVQERGLYFPDKWDAAFEPVLSMHDKGEKPKQGSLLVARYGQGYYIYTGLSFFRELPAAVPGAYRLMANLVSIGKK